MTHSDYAISEGLIELVQEGEKIAEADKQLNTALGRFEIASRRYAAVRDTVTDMLGIYILDFAGGGGLRPYAEPLTTLAEIC